MSLLSVKNLSKAYRSYGSEWQRIGRWFGLPCKAREEHWVLRNVSFEIHAGEAVGIVGQNGAGKSTLLKMITGTLQPTEGSVRSRGRIAAILELGMGFNPELSGRENALHSAGLMGFSREQVLKVMPEIEDFAEIGDYFDEPVRTYSSGMQSRVAFAITTTFRPDILIVDEALAVGDIYFQHKCMQRIRAFQEQGMVLLLVSHDPGAVKSLCNRALLIDSGTLIKDDRPDSVIDYYNAAIAKLEQDHAIRQVESLGGEKVTRSGNGKAAILDVSLHDARGQDVRAVTVGEPLAIRCRIAYAEAIGDGTLGIVIRDRLGNDIYGTNTYHTGTALPGEAGTFEVSFEFVANLGYGSYSISVASHTHDNHVQDCHDWWDRALVFQVVPGNEPRFVGSSHLSMVTSTRSLPPSPASVE
ncbi:ABC transporter ATP-binding protein [Pseudomonas sp. RIT-PI-AD]|uniref:ABC transporter ATP-binding protein n=1 Tax=Pseudomonas sp. RIT-PI-AD TaxID=3035294 RepID=UPI0021D8C329|nr:ABC transporter ATP-binding protein [Pseudomonas sp. RIT-PI-AD]